MAPSPTSRRRAEPEHGAEVGEAGSERRALEVVEAMTPQGEPQKRKKEKKFKKKKRHDKENEKKQEAEQR